MVMAGACCALGPLSSQAQEEPEAAPVAASLEILSPHEGQRVTPGAMLAVRVKVDAAAPISSVSIVSKHFSAMKRAEPFEFWVSIPAEAMGPFVVSAIGKDTAGQTWSEAEVGVMVHPGSPLLRLQLQPRFLSLFPGEPPRGVRVLGIFADGKKREIPASELVFQTRPPGVVEVTPQGRLRARFPGKAVVSIEYGRLRADLPVRVLDAVGGPFRR